MCPPFIGMEGRNGMANTVKKEGRDGGHAVKSGWYPSLVGGRREENAMATNSLMGQRYSSETPRLQ